MANKVKKVKQGMGGNRHGGRSEKTEVLKLQSKKSRRLEGIQEIANVLADEPIDHTKDKANGDNGTK
jgi:hypothetical protein